MEIDEALEALSALSQETRLSIFRRLVRSGPSGEAAGGIAQALAIPSPTLSFHLKELERAGLIVQHRESRNIIYAARYDRMREFLSFLMKDCCAGNPQICDFDFKEICCEPATCAAPEARS